MFVHEFRRMRVGAGDPSSYRGIALAPRQDHVEMIVRQDEAARAVSRRGFREIARMPWSSTAAMVAEDRSN